MERINHGSVTRMPADELDGQAEWEKLTFKGTLLAHLQQCVSRRAPEAEFRQMLAGLDDWDAWQKLVQVPELTITSYGHQSRAARALIQLAQLTARQPALSAEQLLEQTDSGFDAAWRWDAYRALSGNARKPLPGTQQSVSVLLEQDEFGCLARLETELIADGAGQLYADPTANAFLEFDAGTFLAGAREVWELVKRQFAEPTDQEQLAAVDVRFRLIRLHVPNYRNPQLHYVSGRSAQAAFFLSLFQTAGEYLGKSEALLLGDTLAASATIASNSSLGGVSALESKLEAAYLKGLAVVVVSKTDEAAAQKAQRDAQARHKDHPLTTEVVGLGAIAELLGFLRDRAKEREAVRDHEQKKCRKLNILDQEVEIEAHYQVLPLLREVKRDRLPRDEREGRHTDVARRDEDEFTALRGAQVQRWEEELRHEQVIYKQHSLDETLNNFRQVVEEARSDVPRFFVLGPPGSGKTTLAQYLAWRAANRTLKVRGRQLLPARVSLRRWERFCADAKRSLPEYLAEHYQALPHRPTAQHWQSWLQRGETLLLLDGLDEVDGRAVFIEALIEALSAYPECPTIITCRTVSFEQHRKLTPDFPVFTLAGLSDESRDKYIRAFPAGAHFDADALIAQLNRTPQMRALAANPLLLSIICYVVDDPDGVKLPARRSELYNKAIQKLLTRAKRVEITYPGGETDLPLARKRAILERAALMLFANLDQQRQLTFDDASLLIALTKAAEEEGYRANPAPYADALLADLLRNSGLLRGDVERGYFFLHLTVQEYLTASAIAKAANESGWEIILQFSGRDTSLRQSVDRKAWDPRWQEVIILLAGQLDDPLPLLNLLADKHKDDYLRHRLALAAQCLPEVRPVLDQRPLEVVDFSRRALLPALLKSSLDHRPLTIIDQITTNAFSCWWGHKITQTDDLVPHLARALSALGQASGYIDVNRCNGQLRRLIDSHHPGRQQKISLLDLFDLLGAVSESSADRDYMDYMAPQAAEEAIYLIGMAATPEILARLAAMLRNNRIMFDIRRLGTISRLGTAAATPEILDELLRWNMPESINVIGSLGTAAATPKFLTYLAEIVKREESRPPKPWYMRTHDEIFHKSKFGPQVDRHVSASLQAAAGLGAAAASPEFLACLIGLLRSQSASFRKTAVAAISGLRRTVVTPKFLDDLAELLSEQDVGVQRAAIETVGYLGATAATSKILVRLAGLLFDQDANMRDMVAATIGKIGSAAAIPETLNCLAKLLNDRDKCYTAMGLISYIGAPEATPEILACLATRLRDWDYYPYEALNTVDCLGGQAATPAIRGALEQLLDVQEVRYTAVQVICHLDVAAATPESLSHLSVLLSDQDAKVRAIAARSLGRFGDDIATLGFLARLADLLCDRDADVRSAVVDAVNVLGSAVATHDFLSHLAKLLGEQDPEMRRAVLRAIGCIGPVAATDEILSHLAELLDDRETIFEAYVDVRDMIWRLGAAAATPEILRRLAGLLNDQYGGIRDVAAEIVGGNRVLQSIPDLYGLDGENCLGVAAAKPEFLASLAKLLRNDDLGVRILAMRVVRELGPAAATSEILAGLADLLCGQNDGPWELGRGGMVGHEVSRINVGLAGIRVPLRELPMALNARQREEAVQALSRLGAKAARPSILLQLANLLHEKQNWIAEEAIKRLGSVAATPQILTGLIEQLRLRTPDPDGTKKLFRIVSVLECLTSQGVRIFVDKGGRIEGRSIKDLSQLFPEDDRSSSLNILRRLMGILRR